MGLVYCMSGHYLITVAHEGPPRVLGPQETVHQHGPAQREVKTDVFLKVATESVTSQVITEAEAVTGHQLVHLLPDFTGQERLQALCLNNRGDTIY